MALRIIEGVKTLGQLLQTGAARFVAGLLAAGKTLVHVTDLLKRKYPGAPGPLVTEARNRGTRAWQAGQWAGAIDPDERVPRSEVPVNPTLPAGTAYRAIVEVQFRSGDRTWTRIIEVDFTSNPTRAVLEAAAMEEARQLYQSGQRPRQDYDPQPEAAVSVTDVVSLERRTW